MPLLPSEELADFWALGIPVDARYVPDDDYRRALAEQRVQEACSWSSMGTAETSWQPAGEKSERERCVVVPPGRVAARWDEKLDERDTLCWLWQPHWDDQRDAALAHLRAEHHPAFFSECARMLVDLEQRWDRDRGDADRARLVRRLVAEGPTDAATIESELAGITSAALLHLVDGVRACRLTRKPVAAFDAVMAGAERFRPRTRHYNWDQILEVQRDARIALLRFVVRLAVHR